MQVLGIEAEGAGTNNQIRGVILEACTKKEAVPVTRDCLLKANDGRLLHIKNFANQEEFRLAVQQAVSAYLTANKAPEFVILPVDHAAAKDENNNVDILADALKQAFATHGHKVKTMALASNLYDYQHIDLIHVGEHLLSNEDELKLASNPKLRQRVVKTLGVPSNISWQHIGALAAAPKMSTVLQKYQNKKNVLFSLGGKTDNGAIKFTLKDAENLFAAALKLKARGYNVIFTNSPRTPNDVTDYLFEKCKTFHMDFYNSKKVATSAEEKNNFRFYDGRHNTEFQKSLDEIGNIYPAVLSVCDFVINTHDSFSYTSDAAAIGLPSVVYTKNEIDSSRPDCHKLFKLCHAGGYAIDLDEALSMTDSGKSIATKKMDNVSRQLVSAMQRECGLVHSRSFAHEA